ALDATQSREAGVTAASQRAVSPIAASKMMPAKTSRFFVHYLGRRAMNAAATPVAAQGHRRSPQSDRPDSSGCQAYCCKLHRSGAAVARALRFCGFLGAD